jgi:hypothetical protein
VAAAVTVQVRHVHIGLADTELAWLAGFYEGEGYFFSTYGGGKHGRNGSHPTIFWRLGIAGTDPDVIERVAHITGVGNVRIEHRRGSHKTIYRWEVTREREAFALALALYPMLGARRRQRIWGAYREWRRKRRAASLTVA